MKSVVVLSVSAWSAVFIFLRSCSTSLSPVICFVIVFPFRAVVRSKSAQTPSWIWSAHMGRHSRGSCVKRAAARRRRSGRPSLARLRPFVAPSQGGALRVGDYIHPLRVRRGFGVVVVVPVPPLVRRGL